MLKHLKYPLCPSGPPTPSSMCWVHTPIHQLDSLRRHRDAYSSDKKKKKQISRCQQDNSIGDKIPFSIFKVS